jgi:hypothetical protein
MSGKAGANKNKSSQSNSAPTSQNVRKSNRNVNENPRQTLSPSPSLVEPRLPRNSKKFEEKRPVSDNPPRNSKSFNKTRTKSSGTSGNDTNQTNDDTNQTTDNANQINDDKSTYANQSAYRSSRIKGQPTSSNDSDPSCQSNELKFEVSTKDNQQLPSSPGEQIPADVTRDDENQQGSRQKITKTKGADYCCANSFFYNEYILFSYWIFLDVKKKPTTLKFEEQKSDKSNNRHLSCQFRAG